MNSTANGTYGPPAGSRLSFKGAGSGQALQVTPLEGIVTAIVSVTGVVDNDGDIIEPGAYAKTLQFRRPKVVWHHKWEKPIGRVLDIEELLPGDPRLPKFTKDGQPWPAEAGALLVTKQYNLQSERGREAFEDVRFFSETGEAEYSIGYVVPAGKARKGRDGVRRIRELDLYEISPVLFGANSLSGTLAVKDGRPDDGDVWGDLDSPADSLHPFVPGEQTGPDVDAGAVPCRVCGLPAGDGVHAVQATLDLEGKAGVPGVADTPADEESVRRLRAWYVHGDGAQRIGWGTPGDFGRCEAIAGKHMTPEQAKGWCANRHKDATGQWPGPGAHQHAEGKCLDGGGAGSVHPAGSWEERRDLLADAVRELLLGPESEAGGTLDADGDADAPEGGDAGGQGRWVAAEINGTWDDQVVATRYGAGPGRVVESFEIPYQVTGEGAVEFGQPQPVKLTLTPIPADGAAVGDVGGAEPSPLPGMIDDVTATARTLMAAAPGVEGKATLSGLNRERLVAAVQALMEVLAEAGVRLTPPEPADTTGGDLAAMGADVAAAVAGEQDTTAPSARYQGKELVDPRAYAASLRTFAQSAAYTPGGAVPG